MALYEEGEDTTKTDENNADGNDEGTDGAGEDADGNDEGTDGAGEDADGAGESGGQQPEGA